MKKNTKNILMLSAMGILALGALTGCGNKGGNSQASSAPLGEKGEYVESCFAKTGYTLTDFLGSTASLQWNPLTWETADDSSVLAYLSGSLYDYDLNETKDGWVVVNELAAAAPEDVTADYVGRYGISAGEKSKAFKIKLNMDATWQNGDPITADDYIYTMQQALDQAQMNRRADSFYAGDFAIYKAKNYLYHNMSSFGTLSANGKSLAEAQAEGKEILLDLWDFWGAKGYVDAAGNECPQYVSITDTTVYDVPVEGGDAISGKDAYDTYFAPGAAYESYGPEYLGYMSGYGDCSWDEVGFFKDGDDAIVIVIENELDNANFYLPYNLSSISLVHKDTYEKCWKTGEDGQKYNTYGTTLEDTMSYGPYKMATYEADKQITFARNQEWYGYKAGLTNGAEAHVGQYQTSDIKVDVIAKHETALLSFMSGGIDSVGLQAADLEKYGTSNYLVYTPQSYTTKVSFNTDESSLEKMEAKDDKVSKKIYMVKEFREAFSYAINRSSFVSQFSPAAAAGYGMLNYMYQVFLSDGSATAYRDLDASKEAILKLYGITYGKGQKYETLDAAYEAITGYDVEKAKALFTEAYTKAKEAGYYKDGQKVEIVFSVYQEDAIYVNMIKFFDEALKAATAGTPLEGLVSMTYTVDDDYYNSMYAGKCEMIYTTWGGATYGTLGVLSNCYVDGYENGAYKYGDGTKSNCNQMEIGYDTTKVIVDYTINGTKYSYSLAAWANWLGAKESPVTEALGQASTVAYEVRNGLLAELEYTYLESYVTIPVYYRQSASLVSKKINYGTSTYVDLIGFGGLRNITFNYTDAEWAEFIKTADNLKY